MADAHSIDLSGYVFKPFPKKQVRFINLSRRRFGRLKVLGYLGHSKWLCRCDCGTVKPVGSNNLRYGDAKSCGCSFNAHKYRRWEPIDYGNGTVGIPLNRGLVALIDAEDLSKVQGRAWTAWQQPHSTTPYVKCTNPRRKASLHRLVMDAPTGREVDHINGNGLDNRKSNLRLCNNGQNQCNTPPRRNNTSGYKGVSWKPNCGKRPWLAAIGVNRQRIRLGQFATVEEAACAYDEAAKKYHGEFAWLNFPNATAS